MNNLKKIMYRAEDVVQLVMYLSCKHKNLNLSMEIHRKKLGMLMCTFIY